MTEHQLSMRPIGENDYSVMREGRAIGRTRNRRTTRSWDVDLGGHGAAADANMVHGQCRLNGGRQGVLPNGMVEFL
jgi:hypothetical protein